MANNGYEYALTLLIVAVSLVFSGAGSFSIDKAISAKS
jgi:putative oxidoreductase